MTSSSDKLRQITGGTHARIDLDAYSRNVGRLIAMLPHGTALMAVVKADAYGHGTVECAHAAMQAGAQMLGVARIMEAIALRRAGVQGDILVLGPPNLDEVPFAIDHDVVLTLGSASSVGEIASAVTSSNTSLRVHLKIDTGMHRFGVLPSEAPAVVMALRETPGVLLEGIFTHFASADERTDEPTRTQIDRFSSALEAVREGAGLPEWIHLANSGATLSGRWGGGNLVRCGIATYGLSPSTEVQVPHDFEPVMSVVSRIGRRFVLEEGEGVSYGLTYRSRNREELATVPAGYADGLSRDLSNTGWFAADGARLPIRGRVCMDQTVVGDAERVREGQDVTVIGTVAPAMTLDDVAALTGTINYELATRITARVPRLYYRDGRPVSWDHTLLGERGSFG